MSISLSSLYTEMSIPICRRLEQDDDQSENKQDKVIVHCCLQFLISNTMRKLS